jgi:predicted HicB family RNase H-like nuclease
MKSLKISKELHSSIKKYCSDNGIKLNYWVEKQLEIKLKEFINECGRKD